MTLPKMIIIVRILLQIRGLHVQAAEVAAEGVAQAVLRDGAGGAHLRQN